MQPQEVEAELDRILASPGFRNSARRSSLLSWLVRRVLAGDAEPVKEHRIGLEVLGKPESWDPRIDPAVRVEFNRVRQKLRDFYAGEGSEDEIVIEFPSRGYVPVFRRRTINETAAPIPAETAPPGRRTTWVASIGILIILIAAIGFFSPLVKTMRRGQANAQISSIAVLPFLDLSPNHAYEYLVDGFTDEMTNALAALPKLQVIARTSAFQFKGKSVDVREIGRQLGVNAVLEGSFLRQDDRVRVIVQLNRTADGTHLWTAQYDRDAKNILGIEDEITQAVAGALQLRLAGPPPVEFDPGQQALDEYMRGMEEESKSGEQDLRVAEQHYRRAIELAPRYAMAYTRLASIHIARSSRSSRAQAELEQARQYLENSLALDPRLSAAHAALACVNYILNWDWPSAEAHFHRALDFGPSSSTGHRVYAWALTTRGQFAEAERNFREAMQLDPLNLALRYNMAGLFDVEGRGAEARQQIESGLKQQPEWFLGRLSLAYLDVFGKRPSEALSEFQRLAASAPDSVQIEPGLAMAYAESGRRSEALALMQKMEQHATEKEYVRYQLALVSAYLGDSGRLFHWLEQSAECREQQILRVRVDPVFAPYQSDARMVALERRIGLIP